MSAPTFVSLGTQVQATGTASVSWPTHQVGDIAILVNQHDASLQASLSGVATGWNLIGDTGGVGTGISATRATVWWCRATTTSMPTVVVNDAGDHNIAQIALFRGCIDPNGTTNPVSVITSGNTANGTAFTIDALTTIKTDTMILCFVGGGGLNNAAVLNFGTAGPTNSVLTGFTLDSDTGSTINNDGGACSIIHGSLPIIGSTGTITGTKNSTTFKAWIMISLLSTTSVATLTGSFFPFFNSNK